MGRQLIAGRETRSALTLGLKGASALALALVLASLAIPAGLWADVGQTDWAGGAGISGPVTDWGREFEASSGASWLAVPGQLALSSHAAASPPEHLLSDAYTGTIGVDVGDVDNDGDIDVVGTADVSGMVLLWVNQGGDPLTWTEQLVANPPGAAGVDLADVDGDGRLDVVLALIDPRNKIVWKQNLGGDPIVWGTQTVESSWGNTWEMATADINADGHLDVVATKWSPGEVAWWENDGASPIVWTKRPVAPTLAGAHSVRGADLDGDGDMDLATAAGLANRITVFWSDGANPPVWTAQILDSTFVGARSVWIGDIDGDGDPDIAGICWDNHIAWWSNGGGSPAVWTRQTISDTAYGGHGVSIADMNGDGRLDVLAACINAGKIAWYENGGGSPITWTEHVIRGSWPGAATVRAADLDLDGDLDAAGACYTAGEFSWWEPTEFDSTGSLTGSVLDAGLDADLARLEWTSVAPAGTGLRFQVRSSDDPADLGEWSGDITVQGCLPEALGRYIQYRLFMETSDPASSPILKDLVFASCPAGIASPIESPLASDLRAQPNPCPAQAIISFRLRTGQAVRLSVFDASGRRVRQLAGGWLEEGSHRFDWDGLDDGGNRLSSGLYWLRLEMPELRETRKMVLIR
ncbi:MAG: FG-GAP-like repeat-containing protein [bacterium]